MSGITIPNGGTIGSAGDADAITISSSGAVTLSSDFVPATPLSHRNMIINGGMQVSQRGTTFTDKLAANSNCTLDRFATEWYNGSETAKATISQYSLGTTESPRVNEGLIYAYELDCTTAITDQNANTNNLETIDYRIEAQDCQRLRYGTASAQTVSLSFWFKSPKAGIHIVSLMQVDNSNKIYLREFTVASADTWQKIHVTFPGDTSGVINNDNGAGLRISWPLYAGNNRHGSKDEWRAYGVDHTTSNQQNLLDNTANNIYLTGVQLELGSVATPFEHRSYADELRRCHRYFQKFYGSQNYWGSGAWYSTTHANIVMDTFGPMRADPTGTSSSVGDFRIGNSNMSGVPAVTGMTITTDGTAISGKFRLFIEAGSGGAAGNGTVLLSYNGSTEGIINLDAEL